MLSLFIFFSQTKEFVSDDVSEQAKQVGRADIYIIIICPQTTPYHETVQISVDKVNYPVTSRKTCKTAKL